ncbi:hypothetical protein ACJ5NV_19775 [Loktanella agnita]|uniref:hypothetical protein n=1 Tax=Loktanella agnita TaxID=287097 RepID=UPI003988B347
MDNQTFIAEADMEDTEVVELLDVPPMSVWQKFIGIFEKPDAIVPFQSTNSFESTFSDFLLTEGIEPRDRLFINVGGDSTKKWVSVEAGSLMRVWVSGLKIRIEIECAILLPNRRTIVGITVEEGEEYWFFKRKLY